MDELEQVNPECMKMVAILGIAICIFLFTRQGQDLRDELIAEVRQLRCELHRFVEQGANVAKVQP